jgi:hypothetical protein
MVDGREAFFTMASGNKLCTYRGGTSGSKRVKLENVPVPAPQHYHYHYLDTSKQHRRQPQFLNGSLTILTRQQTHAG